MKKILSLMFVAAALFGSDFAEARQRLVLEMYDAHLRGQNTIALKREIRNQYPNIRLNRFTIKRVRLVAKTKRGQGTATLDIGQWKSSPKRVYGNRDGFQRNGRHTYDKVDFYNDRYNNRGPWQMKLRGNFKVKKIVVILKRRNGGGGGGGYSQSIKCESWGYAYNTCYVNGRIQSLNLTRKVSNSACIKGQSWGYTNNYIWVDRGCRAHFNVRTR